MAFYGLGYGKTFLRLKMAIHRISIYMEKPKNPGCDGEGIKAHYFKKRRKDTLPAL